MEMVAAAVATAVEQPRPPSRPPERHVPQCRQRHWPKIGGNRTWMLNRNSRIFRSYLDELAKWVS